MSEDLIQRVTKVIATSKRIPLETVTTDSEFVQLGIDSMDAVEILFALEGEFDISIPDEEVRSVRNVRDMCSGVERLVAAKSADAHVAHVAQRARYVLGRGKAGGRQERGRAGRPVGDATRRYHRRRRHQCAEIGRAHV